MNSKIIFFLVLSCLLLSSCSSKQYATSNTNNFNSTKEINTQSNIQQSINFNTWETHKNEKYKLSFKYPNKKIKLKNLDSGSNNLLLSIHPKKIIYVSEFYKKNNLEPPNPSIGNLQCYTSNSHNSYDGIDFKNDYTQKLLKNKKQTLEAKNIISKTNNEWFYYKQEVLKNSFNYIYYTENIKNNNICVFEFDNNNDGLQDYLTEKEIKAIIDSFEFKNI